MENENESIKTENAGEKGPVEQKNHGFATIVLVFGIRMN